MNASAYGFLAGLGQKISAISGDNRETCYVFQRISVLIQHFNTTLLLCWWEPLGWLTIRVIISNLNFCLPRRELLPGFKKIIITIVIFIQYLWCCFHDHTFNRWMHLANVGRQISWKITCKSNDLSWHCLIFWMKSECLPMRQWICFAYCYLVLFCYLQMVWFLNCTIVYVKTILCKTCVFILCLVYFLANQQTVVELIGFFQRAFPQGASVRSSAKKQIDQSEPLVIEVRIFEACCLLLSYSCLLIELERMLYNG